MLKIEPITLEGNYILLRPPLITDVFGLSLAAKDGEIWNTPYAFFPAENDISAFLQDLLKGSNSFLPFIIVNKQSDTILGSTRYLNIDYDNYRMEIGHTWIRKSFRRTAVNTETKLLMLQYAFEKLNCIAIEIRTDVLNTVSRRAIERLGAKEDGILRNHKIMKNGRMRDTVCYSIIQSEWPLVKENLLQKMSSYDNNYACPVILK
ncbi:MAG TPA: GNAT family protein [Candidatus Bathyarchaeia archaeon]|jgi:RimJ/RimL family protein N-acetyltransferase|nr:GNAT family protein [Candidatus Bathyarchaeia archaeon]